MSKKCYFCPNEEIWISLRSGRVNICFHCMNDYDMVMKAYNIPEDELNDEEE